MHSDSGSRSLKQRTLTYRCHCHEATFQRFVHPRPSRNQDTAGPVGQGDAIENPILQGKQIINFMNGPQQYGQGALQDQVRREWTCWVVIQTR